MKCTTVYILCMEISANIVHLWDNCKNKRDQICQKNYNKEGFIENPSSWFQSESHFSSFCNIRLCHESFMEKGHFDLAEVAEVMTYTANIWTLISSLYFVLVVWSAWCLFLFSVSFPDCGEPIPTEEPVLDQWVRFHSITSEYIAVIVYRISYKTSQELQMLPRSLSVCQSTIKSVSKVSQ